MSLFRILVVIEESTIVTVEAATPKAAEQIATEAIESKRLKPLRPLRRVYVRTVCGIGDAEGNAA